MNLRFKSLLAAMACLLTSSCGDVWLGDEKVLDLKGERISLVTKVDDLRIVHNNKKVHLDRPHHINSWPVSGANFKQSASNIAIDKFDSDYKNRISFSTSNDIAVSSEPIIVDNHIYMIGADGVIFSSDLDGKTLWSNNFFHDLNKKSFFDFFSSNFVSGGLSKSDNTIYASGGYNVVIAINTHSGETIWSTKLSSPTRSAPIKIKDNTILVQTIDNKIFALDTSNGEIIWAHFGIHDDLSILSGFSLDTQGSKVAFQYSTGEIFVLNSNTGDEIWNDTVSSPLDSSYNEGSLMRVASSPLIIDNMLIAYGGDGYAAAFDLETGKDIWKKELSISKPFWVSGKFMFAINKVNTILAANIETGNVIWKYDLSQHTHKVKLPHWTPPIIVNSQVFTISTEGTGILLDAHNGQLRDIKDLPRGIFTKPIALDSGVYLTSNDGYIYQY